MYDSNLNCIYMYIEFKEDNLELWKYVIVWLDLPDQLCKYCRNMYTGLFSAQKRYIYRRMLSTESSSNHEFNCRDVKYYDISK
jgi:hypothetical protein